MLKPYSIGHDLRLIKLHNPLVDEYTATPLQLAEAVLVCHQSWREFERMRWDPLISFKFWLWRRRARNTKFPQELDKFITYRDAANEEFPLSTRGSVGSDETQIAGTPFLLRLQQFMMLKCGLKEDEAWDYPLSLAKCRWSCYCEEIGQLRVKDLAEISLEHYRDQENAKEALAV